MSVDTAHVAVKHLIFALSTHDVAFKTTKLSNVSSLDNYFISVFQWNNMHAYSIAKHFETVSHPLSWFLILVPYIWRILISCFWTNPAYPSAHACQSLCAGIFWCDSSHKGIFGFKISQFNPGLFPPMLFTACPGWDPVVFFWFLTPLFQAAISLFCSTVSWF